MIRVTVDEFLLQRLRSLTATLDLYDGAGRRLGRFIPVGDESPTTTRIEIDGALRSKLHNLTEPLELCDSTGKVVGRFEPAFDPSEYQQWEPKFSDEELLQEEQSQEKRYTTAEVLAHLSAMENR